MKFTLTTKGIKVFPFSKVQRHFWREKMIKVWFNVGKIPEKSKKSNSFFFF